MGKGSSGTKTTYTQSPEQRKMFQALLPMIRGLSEQGFSQIGQPNLGAPSAPTMPGFNAVSAPNMPSMTGVLSGVQPYQIPSTESMMPTQSWWNSLSPDVMAGVWSPYQQASKGMLEQLGGIGQLGSARGGASGAAGAALGQFGADAANKVGLQAWQMSQPAMQAGWQAQLGQNQQGYQNQLTESQTNYNNQMNQQQQNYQQGLIANQTNYANEVARQQADFGMAQQAWGMPLGMTGMMPGTYSQGITTQPSQNPNFGGMGMGAIGGAGLGALGVGLAPATFGTSLLAPMLGGGLLGGMMGGK